MNALLQKIKISTLALLFAFGGAITTHAEQKPNVDEKGLAVQGYDVVAFFKASKAVKGSPEFSTTHEGATYHFSSKENLAAFAEKPAKYLPQYDGFCAYGVTKGGKFPVQIETWQIVDGRLFLNKNPDVKVIFEKDLKNHIKTADAKWPEVAKK